MLLVDVSSVKITDSGLEAVLRLAAGDMRKSLNVLQACAAAYTDITEERVYECTGNPLPSEIGRIVQWLLNESYSTAYSCMCLASLIVVSRWFTVSAMSLSLPRHM